MPGRIAIALAVGLSALTVAYAVASPSHGSVDHVAASPSPTPSPTPTSEAAANALPPGLHGRLTYRTGTDLVTVQFPGAREVERKPATFAASDAVSVDGQWRAHRDCSGSLPDGTQRCRIDLIGEDGSAHSLDVDVDLQWSHDLQWSPSGHVLALRIMRDGAPQLAVVDDPASPSLRLLPGDPRLRTPNIADFAWMADGQSLLVARGDGIAAALFRIDVSSGSEEIAAKLAELPNFLYPSPDRSLFAFTASSPLGWHLYLFDPALSYPGDVRDFGAMGSDGSDATPVTGPPDVKTPMYIAWSPDGTKLAFGGGFEPPYVMKIVDIARGAVLTTQFPDGYPGEIKWSPDGTHIAVSTYNIPRTHHESYVVDPATGAARDVLSGCVIVWSPDGRFLAVHGEKEPGIAIADIATLDHAQLTHTAGDTPLAWDDVHERQEAPGFPGASANYRLPAAS